MSKSKGRPLYPDISVISLIAGYIFGLFVPRLFGTETLFLAPGESISPLLTRGGEFFETLSAQYLCPGLIFFLGFIPDRKILASCVIFSRAALASFSSLSYSFTGLETGEYLLHALCGAGILAVCVATTISSSDARERPTLYTLKFTFFSGIFFIILFLRSVLLAFV